MALVDAPLTAIQTVYVTGGFLALFLLGVIAVGVFRR